MAALELDAHRLQKKGIQDYLARNKGTGSMLSITVKESIIARSGDADLAIIITTAKDCKFKTSLCVRVSIFALKVCYILKEHLKDTIYANLVHLLLQYFLKVMLK